jgi:enoyl-CoA hydratase
MYQQLIDACSAVNMDLSVGAAVIRGDGGSFCAGSDRRDMTLSDENPASDESRQRMSIIYDTFRAVGDLAVPSIAAVRGHALGGGLNLALVADVRIVSETARLASGFFQNGIHPGGGFYSLLGRTAGRQTAAMLGVFGVAVGGRDAAASGLAWKSVPDEDVDPLAMEYAHAAAADPGLSRAMIESLREELGPPPLPWSTAVEIERAKQAWSRERRKQRS